MSSSITKVSAREAAENARREGNAEFLALSKVTRQVLEKYARRIQFLEVAVVALAVVVVAEAVILWMHWSR
jgi:hypothetical protein